MISLRDDFESEPHEPGRPCTAEDIAFLEGRFQRDPCRRVTENRNPTKIRNPTTTSPLRAVCASSRSSSHAEPWLALARACVRSVIAGVRLPWFPFPCVQARRANSDSTFSPADYRAGVPTAGGQTLCILALLGGVVVYCDREVARFAVKEAIAPDPSGLV